MNRQETIIRITKINRFVKQLNYWCELNIEINLDVFGEELYSIDQWTAEVHEYLRENPTTALVGMVEDIGSTVTIREYMSGAGKRLPARLRQTLNSYISHMEALQKDCGLLHKQSKGRYANLPDKLANGKAVDLLLRAVKAGYLDKEYQPLSEATSLQLKAIAFAVSQLMCFNSRHTYVYFDRLWMRGTYNLSSVTTPRLSDKGYKGIVELYPEADFSGFITNHEGAVFNSLYDEERKLELYCKLVYNGYIDRSTTKSQFLGIFDKDKFAKPVNWIREQRLLSYFVKCAFDATNNRNLWVKAHCCFLVNGKQPHKESFITGYAQLARSGELDIYNTDLKSISEEYCRASDNEETTATSAANTNKT